MMFLLFLLSFTFTLNLGGIPNMDEVVSPATRPATKDPSFYASLPAQVVLTDLGWNHANPRAALQFGRTKFQAYLNRGIEKHPWYNPSGWRIYRTDDSPIVKQRIYVFLDLETCYEENFPNYGWGLTANSDRENGRPYLSSSGGQIRHMKSVCPVIDHILDSPLFEPSNNHNAVLILFDCGWNGPPQWSCLNRHHNPKLRYHNVSIVSESASFKDNQRSILDLGLPPPAIHQVHLSPSQQEAIVTRESCDVELLWTIRPYLFTFVGNFRHSVRQHLLKLHNPQAGIVVQHHYGNLNSSSVGRGVHAHFANQNRSYTTLMSRTQFAGVPRGDNLFSYRFTEALSGGCIPVVYADGWVLPFSKALIDWSSVAVIIPEQDVDQTFDYLHNLTLEQRCQMRKTGYEFFKKYMATSEGIIAGIVESLERLLELKP